METFKKLSAERQHFILDAAAEAFAEKGYYGTSIKDICHLAGISNGALYKYFKNKEAVFLSVLNRCQLILTNHLFEKHTVNFTNLFKAIENYLFELDVLYKNYPHYVKVYSQLGSNNMEEFLQNLTDNFKASRSYIYEMVQSGKDQGHIKEWVDVNQLSFLLDNYFILFLLSFVSDYHERRFYEFIDPSPEEHLTTDMKVEFILNSVQVFFKDEFIGE